MAKKRVRVTIEIHLEGTLGNNRESFPDNAIITAQACSVSDSTLIGPLKQTTLAITGTDTLDAFKTAVLAAVDDSIGIP